jgi:hypothetical protein
MASGPVTVGSPIHDVAHLSGGVGTITGSIPFQVFAPTDTTCSTPTKVRQPKGGLAVYYQAWLVDPLSGAFTSWLAHDRAKPSIA